MATHWEAAPVLRQFGFKRFKAGLYRADFGGHPLFLAVSGVGKEAARRASDRLCQEGAGVLLSAGFCGALVSELKVGQVLTERVATSATPVRSRAEREALTRRANALAVDMETQAVIEAGTLRGVPIRVLRVVSDELDDDLTPLFGSDATFSPWRIGVRLLNPTVWALANRLRKNSAIAKRNLVSALQLFLAHPETLALAHTVN